MMRNAVLALLSLTVSAWAGPPREIAATQQIILIAGQSKALVFDEQIRDIVLTQKGIAEVTPLNDRQLSVVGLKAGITQMIVAAPDGRQIYSAEVLVSSEPGHLVKMYGVGKNDDLNAGYSAVYCDDRGCGRPDRDLPLPTAITIERTTRKIESNVYRGVNRK